MKLTEHISYIRSKYPKIGRAFTPDNPDQSEQAGFSRAYLDNIQKASSLLVLYNENLKVLTDRQVLLADGLGRVTRLQEMYNEQAEKVIEQITYLEKQNASLNKSFGITSERAAVLGAEFRGIAGETKRGQAAIFGYAESLKSLTGGFIASSKMDVNFRKNLIASRAVMQGNLGVTAEAAEGFEKYAASMKMTSTELLLSLTKENEAGESFVKTLANRSGLEETAILKTIIEDISSLSSSVRKNFSKMPGNLEAAVVKAKALGVSLTEVQKIGKSLLSIESSVGEELNYQMITGRRIVDGQGNSITNQYRIAYLQKDATKQADLLREAVELQADALDNPVALEQFAKTFSTSEDQVADILTQIELAKQMGAEGILKLKNPAEISKAMAEAQQAYIEKAGDDPERKKEAAAQFAELSKKFFAAKDKDTRTSHEAIVESNLSIMAAGINKMAGTGLNQEVLVKRAREAAEDIAERTNKVSGKFVNKESAMALSNKSATQNANMLGQVTQTIAENTTSSTNPDTVAITAQNETIKKGNVNGVRQGDLNRTPTTNTVETNDALIIPDKGPILRPAANDVIAAFRPNDVIDRTLNQINLARSLNQITPTIETPDQSLVSNQITPDRESILRPRSNDEIVMQKQNSITNNQTTATTNTTNTVENITNRYTQQAPALDINALANAIASAVSKIKVEATIKQDTFLGTTNMNDSRMFT